MRRLAAFSSFLLAVMFPAWIGPAQAIVGGEQMISSMFGGGGGGPNGPAARAGAFYEPQYVGPMDQQYWGLYQDLINQGQTTQGQVDPTLLAAFQQMAGIDYSPYIAAADQAGQTSTQYGDLLKQLSATQMSGVPGMQAAQGQILQTGFDPQNALYNRTAQRLTDQANAINTMYGLGTSGAGAGMTDQTLSNFNIDWQNQQLQREQAAISGATQANAATGADISAASSLYGGAPAAYLGGGAIPLNARQQAAAGPMNAATTYMNAMASSANPLYQLLNPGLQYLNYGVGAQAGAFDASLRNAGFQANQQQQGMSSLMQGLQQPGFGNNLSQWFGGSGSGAMTQGDMASWGTSGGAFSGSDAWGWGGPASWGTDAGGAFSGSDIWGGAEGAMSGIDWGGAAAGIGDMFAGIDWSAIGIGAADAVAVA